MPESASDAVNLIVAVSPGTLRVDALVNYANFGRAPWEPPEPAELVRGAIRDGHFVPVYQERAVAVYEIRVPS